MCQGVRATWGHTRWWSAHTRGRCAPAWAALPPAPGTVSCQTVWASQPGAVRPRPSGTRRQAVLVAHVLPGWSRRHRGASPGRPHGPRPCVQALIQGCRRHGEQRPPWRPWCSPVGPRGRGSPPPPTRAEGQHSVCPSCATGVGPTPGDGPWRHSGLRNSTLCGARARGTLVQPWPSPVARVRTRIPGHPSTARSRLLFSSIP